MTRSMYQILAHNPPSLPTASVYQHAWEQQGGKAYAAGPCAITRTSSADVRNWTSEGQRAVAKMHKIEEAWQQERAYAHSCLALAEDHLDGLRPAYDLLRWADDGGPVRDD